MTILYKKQKKILLDQRYKVDVWLFYGIAGIGKFTVAQSFSNWFLNDASSDIFIINIEDSIGIDLIRDLKSFFYSTSAIGEYKIAIINNAENMTIHAQNALLKILEEKIFKNAIIIIITNNIDIMLNTVVSRCRKMYFPTPQIEEIKLLFPNVSNATIEIANYSMDNFITLKQNFNKDLDSYIKILKEISNSIDLYYNIEYSNELIFRQMLKLAISRIVKSSILNISPLFNDEPMLIQKCILNNGIDHYLEQYFKIVKYEEEKEKLNLDSRYIMEIKV